MKDSNKVVFLSTICNILSFGIVIIASTFFLNSSIPLCATCALTAPSKENGFVTTAIVNAPSSLATAATIGAAPVPVPPPSPAVI
jgi:hypothetical protein